MPADSPTVPGSPKRWPASPPATTASGRTGTPLPTAARVGRRAMLVCCARRHGLIRTATIYTAVIPGRLEHAIAERERHSRDARRAAVGA